MWHFIFIAFLCLLPRTSAAGDVIDGPVAASLVDVVDGDTLTLKAHIWIAQTIEMKVRLLGIDAPELHGDCDSERARARQAKEYLSSLVELPRRLSSSSRRCGAHVSEGDHVASMGFSIA